MPDAKSEASAATSAPILEPPLQGSGFSRFLSKHSRLVTFVGALVVFLTFIVKEALRENLKDLVDSIDSAQSVFMLQRENGSISQHLARIDRTVTASYTNILSPPPGGIPQLNLLAIELHAQDAFDSIQRVEDQLSAADRLLSKVPKSKGEEQSLAKLRSRNDATSKQYKGYTPPGSATPQSELIKPFNDILAIEHEVWNIETDLTTFTASLLQESLEFKKRDECYFKFATWSSYALYGLGWGLGLLGRLYGPKGGDAEEV